jgi:hypothetical protein
MRQAIDRDSLRLPPCPHPRPGQTVIWYKNARRYQGTLLGHRYNGAPTVGLATGYSDNLLNFDEIRPADPFSPAKANWYTLPEGALLLRPLPSEKDNLDSLLNQIIYPGFSYLDIAREIRSRGYEIFLIGGAVRDVISGARSYDVDFITTYPLAKLIPLMQNMCRLPPKTGKQKPALYSGHIRLGGTPQSGEPFIDLSVFKIASTGDENALFGSNFVNDVVNRDFTINSVYYDPVNSVFIDPTGFGINDIFDHILRPVFVYTDRPMFENGKILIRLIKFSMRGYTRRAVFSLLQRSGKKHAELHDP